MQCPNCEFIDRDEVFGNPATCPKCDAIYEKALRVKALREQQEAMRRKKTADDVGIAAQKEKEKLSALKPAPDKPQQAQKRINTAEVGGQNQDDRSSIGVLGHVAKGVEDARAQAAQLDADRKSRSVVITDVDISFWSMVRLLVKLAIASIPALIIIMILIAGFFSLLSVFRTVF